MPKFKLPAVGSIVATVVLLIVVAGVTLGLIYIKGGKQEAAAAAAKATPEFSAAVVSAEVHLTPYTRIRTAIGTVRALRSIMLRNELAGTVRAVSLATGTVVEKGDLLVELDVAVEQAQLAALDDIRSCDVLDDAVHIDFAVTQDVARSLTVGVPIDVIVTPGGTAVKAKITALDARVDANTRNTWIRAELRGVTPLPQPGASVRVSVPVAAEQEVAVVPVSALRRGPEGSSVWVLQGNCVHNHVGWSVAPVLAIK